MKLFYEYWFCFCFSIVQWNVYQKEKKRKPTGFLMFLEGIKREDSEEIGWSKSAAWTLFCSGFSLTFLYSKCAVIFYHYACRNQNATKNPWDCLNFMKHFATFHYSKLGFELSKNIFILHNPFWTILDPLKTSKTNLVWKKLIWKQNEKFLNSKIVSASYSFIYFTGLLYFCLQIAKR